MLHTLRYKAHIPNIHALNSDTHKLRIQYEYNVMDIWYMGLTVEPSVPRWVVNSHAYHGMTKAELGKP